MFKFSKNALASILLCVFALAASACTYDPESYEEQRQKDNAEHDKQGY